MTTVWLRIFISITVVLDLVGVEPAPNNGTYGRLHAVLKNPPSISETAPIITHKKCLDIVKATPCSSSCPVNRFIRSLYKNLRSNKTVVPLASTLFVRTLVN